MDMFTTNEVVYTVDDNGVTTKYKLRVLMENAGIMLNFAEDTVDQITDPFEGLELTQSVNPRHREYDPEMTRRHWRHIPNHNVKRKVCK